MLPSVAGRVVHAFPNTNPRLVKEKLPVPKESRMTEFPKETALPSCPIKHWLMEKKFKNTHTSQAPETCCMFRAINKGQMSVTREMAFQIYESNFENSF